MDATQVLVTVVGLGLMALVAWFFFGAPHRAVATAPSAGDAQQVDIRVKGGDSPDVVGVRRG
ncbi:MAG: hypothetical protein ACRYFR_06995 [Janthinobacterium lividum]